MPAILLELPLIMPAPSESDPIRDRPLHQFNKGQKIPLEPQSLWQVHQGVVKLHMLYVDGQEVLLGLATSPMLLGAPLTCLSAYYATALMEVQLRQFSLAEIDHNPQLTRHLLATTTQRLRQTEALLAISSHRRVQDRLQQLLLLLKDQISHPIRDGYRLDIHLTHEDFANAIGTSRVTVTRLFSKLRQQGLIYFESDRRLVLTERFLAASAGSTALSRSSNVGIGGA